VSGLAADRLVVKRGGATLIDDLSFAATGGSLAVIGPNGAGKSSLLKVMAGLEAPTSGRVRMDERDVATFARGELARTIGYVPQYFEPHWDLTAGELVALGAQRVRNLPADAIARMTSSFELAGLEHRRWSTLSGGERARVLLAMVLVIDPPVVLADEPVASLDIRHRLDVIRTLARPERDRLSIVVVHDLDLAFGYFDRIVVLDHGRLVANAPASELIGDPLLDAVFQVQFERLRTDSGWLLRARPPAD
jgi:iron complex transport system ATP-binding protein